MCGVVVFGATGAAAAAVDGPSLKVGASRAPNSFPAVCPSSLARSCCVLRGSCRVGLVECRVGT